MPFSLVSGTQGSKNTGVAGTTVFGGDVVISGTLHGGSPLKIDGGMEVTGTFEMKPKSGDTAIVRNPNGPVKIFANTNLKLGAGSGIIDLLDLDDGAAGQIVLTGSGPAAARAVELNSPGTLFFTGSTSGSRFKGPVAANDGLSGSLTRLTDGTSYLIAGNNTTIQSASNGQITISSVILQPKKYVYEVTASHGSTQNLEIPVVNFSSLSFTDDKIDVFVNGQLSTSGSSRDYVLPGPTGSIKFNFDFISRRHSDS